MLLIKTLQQFILPSVFIFLFMAAALILIYKQKFNKVNKILLTIAIVLFYLFSITPISDLIIYPLERDYQIKPIDCKINDVVLLAGAMVERSHEILKINNACQGTINIFIAGTNPFQPQDISELLETKQYLIERGLKEERIFLEDRSRNTLESAKNIRSFLADKSFYLVSSAYHLRRAMLAFNHFNLLAIPAPTDFLSSDGTYDLFDFFPNPANLNKANIVFHEYFGYFYYRLKLNY